MEMSELVIVKVEIRGNGLGMNTVSNKYAAVIQMCVYFVHVCVNMYMFFSRCAEKKHRCVNAFTATSH